MDQLLSEAYPSRYMKLNCQSYEIHGTVEFRQHQGTTDGEKIVAWVVFTQMLVERAVAGKIRMKKWRSGLVQPEESDPGIQVDGCRRNPARSDCLPQQEEASPPFQCSGVRTKVNG
jgi:hypothetical protein